MPGAQKTSTRPKNTKKTPKKPRRPKTVKATAGGLALWRTTDWLGGNDKHSRVLLGGVLRRLGYCLICLGSGIEDLTFWWFKLIFQRQLQSHTAFCETSATILLEAYRFPHQKHWPAAGGHLTIQPAPRSIRSESNWMWWREQGEGPHPTASVNPQTCATSRLRYESTEKKKRRERDGVDAFLGKRRIVGQFVLFPHILTVVCGSCRQ